MSANGWLSGINPSWSVIRGKALFSERKEKSKPDDVHLTPSQHLGVLPQTEYMERSGSRVVLNLTGADQMKHVEPDDFVIHLRSFQGGIEHSRYTGKVSNAYTILIPDTRCEPRFFRWVLKCSGFIQELNSLTDQLRDGQSIKYSQFAEMELPLPPLEEQRRIADFLDDQVGRIDQAIALRKRQVKILGEKSKAEIDEMVNGRVSHSGGTTRREAWPVTEFRLLFSQRKEVGRSDLPTLGVSLATGVTVRSADDGRPAASLDQSNYKVVYPTDIVMNALGKPHGSIGRSEDLGITSPAYWVLITNSAIADSGFMHYLLRSDSSIAEYKRLSKFLPPSQLDLSWENFRTIRRPLPPLGEQLEIATVCTKIEAELLSAGTEMSAAIATWEERKRSLITAAVTGQIDVSCSRPLIGAWVSSGLNASVESPVEAAEGAL